MAEKKIKTRIQQKHDIEANWIKATTFVPMAGEIIVYDADSTYTYERFKIGDGSTTVSNLPFVTDDKVSKAGDTMTGKLQVNAPIFGYNYNGGKNANAPAFIFDKSGSNYTGIGANGETDTILFAPVSGDAWVSEYTQKWKFQGDVIANNFTGNLNGTATNATNDGNGNSIADTYVKQSITLANGTDLNTVVTSGFYRLTENHVNGPAGTQYGLLIVNRGSDTITQMVFTYYSSRMFIRCGNPSDVGGSGSWTDWEEVITSGNIGSQSVDNAKCLASNGKLTSIADIDNFLTGDKLKYATFGTRDNNESLGLDFGNDDGMLLSIPWSTDKYGAQIIIDDTLNGNIAFRGKSTNWGSWYKFIHSGNVDTYTEGKMKRGTYKRIEAAGEDLNNYTAPGFYNVKTKNVANCPSGIGIDAVLLVYGWDSSDYELQEITETAASEHVRRWVRKNNGGTWGDWKEIISTENIGNYAKDTNVKLSEDLWTDKTIGYINATSTSPKKVGSKGDTLKTVFTNIFGTVTDDTSNLVTNPYFSSVSIGSASYEYGTKLNSVSVTVSPVAGSYKYGPTTTGSSWSGNYTLSGTGFTTKNNATADTQTVSLSSTFTVGTSSALTLKASRAYTAATATAKSKMGNATTQKISAGTAEKSGTFDPTAEKYVYYAVTSNTTTPSSWTKYGSGQTSVTDLNISANGGQYVWVATTSNCSSFYTFNEVSGKYNTDATPTTKLNNQTITNSQNAKPSDYYIYRITSPKALSGSVRYKLV